MLIKQHPTTTEVTHHICDFHKKNLGKRYAGCTCSSCYKTVTKPIKDWTEQEMLDYFGVTNDRPESSNQ